MGEPPDGFVLDCSVTMAWCFDDEATPETDRIRDALADVRAVVPALWPLEVANATLVGERRKRLDEARGGRFLSLLGRDDASGPRPQSLRLRRHLSGGGDPPRPAAGLPGRQAQGRRRGGWRAALHRGREKTF